MLSELKKKKLSQFLHQGLLGINEGQNPILSTLNEASIYNDLNAVFEQLALYSLKPSDLRVTLTRDKNEPVILKKLFLLQFEVENQSDGLLAELNHWLYDKQTSEGKSDAILFFIENKSTKKNTH